MTGVIKTIYDKDRVAAYHVAGTGADADINIIDVSGLKGAGTSPNVRIKRISCSNTDGTISIQYDAGTDKIAFWVGVGAYSYNHDGNWPSIPSAIDSGESGATGDIHLTKTGSGSYSLVIEVIKVSGFSETDVHNN